MNTNAARSLLVAIPVSVAAAAPGFAASHLWVINEVFSNADGSVQFIEMHNPTSSANETQISTRWVRAVSQGTQFNFPANLPGGSSAFGYLLLGTQGFADLPGAPAVDYLIPDNFFDPLQDDLEYWMYVSGDLAFGPGQLPTDGVLSLNRDLTTGVNSPTNFAGETGSVDLSVVAAPHLAESGTAEMQLRVLPAGGATFRIELQLGSPADVSVDVLDVAGRTVRRLFDGAAAGLARVSWDGRNTAGDPVASGAYFVAASSAADLAVEKAIVVR